MQFRNLVLLVFLFFGINACQETNSDSIPQEGDIVENEPDRFVWQNATVYFLLTDRFNNGDATNDIHFNRTKEAANLRGFMGGDIKGITQKIEEGYFSDLGINAIWFTPVMEQIHGIIDEGTGLTYGYHGYWTKDWTALDPNFGTEADLKEMIEKAHAHGIRVIMDVVANHTGPETVQDPLWEGWARTGPRCTYESMETTISCTLVDNLPDIFTESNDAVDLPSFLVEKWEKEGRKEKELKELDEFFERTGYPRSPRHYIIKWLLDLIKKYGVDGFRVDTVKHTESYVWKELWEEAVKVFDQWKKEHPEKVLDDNPFYMVGEVYNYGISNGKDFDYGDQKVDFYKDGFTSLINFEFKYDAKNNYDSIFTKYSSLLNGPLQGYSVLNYISSHDDGSPYDVNREDAIDIGTKLLLCPGGVQIYYGDESSRMLNADAAGDAKLRSFMNWEEMVSNAERGGHKVQDVLAHWQKVGAFRRDHPAIGAGIHELISTEPYTFQRTFQDGDYTDQVVVALGLEAGAKTISVGKIFADGEEVTDAYSNKTAMVVAGKVTLDTPYDLVLLEK